jgi:NhaA family Na+:H+ antiporter
VGFRHIYGGSILCGIGFTMSLFIADLSFQTAELLDSAKLSVLLGSLLSVVAGTIVLITARNPGVRGGGRMT